MSSRNLPVKYVVSIIFLLLIFIYLGIAFRNSLTPYVSFQDARASGEVVQIKGIRVTGSEKYDDARQVFRFQVKNSNDDLLWVEYPGIKPSNFDQAMEVVVVGRYQGNVFKADNVLVKCPSKYVADAP